METLKIRLAAVADIHAPRYLNLFRFKLREAVDEGFDLLLLAGDLVLHNDYSQIPRIIEVIRKFYNGRIIACFGNEEYEDSKSRYLDFEDIVWLDDEAIVVKLKEVKIGVIGSRGSLDKLTYWQSRFKPELRNVYRRRVEIIEELIRSVTADFKIVLTHYTPTYRTLEGEPLRIWSQMGSRKFESVIRKTKPDIWFHGHAHRGTVPYVEVAGTPVYNVSLPARGKITTVEVEVKEKQKVRDLTAFFET